MDKKGLFFLINVPVWIIIFSAAFIISMSETFKEGGYPHVISTSLVYLTWWLTSYYFAFGYTSPKFIIRKRNNKKFLLSSVLFVFLGGPILFIFLAELKTLLHLQDSFVLFIIEYPKRFIGYWLVVWSGLSFLFYFLGSLCRLAFESFIKIQQARELENKNLQSEIKLIKSQLNPHFLFNTLNNIDALIQTNPNQASIALSSLSDILRYMVYNTENELILLKTEIEALSKYIELEKLRLTNPEMVILNINFTGQVFIAPMIFFPFVENAFKHSNLNKKGQKIVITIRGENDFIEFYCSNSISKIRQTEERQGIGLELAKKRLELLYPGKHTLKIEKTESEYFVKLQLFIKNVSLHNN